MKLTLILLFVSLQACASTAVVRFLAMDRADGAPLKDVFVSAGFERNWRGTRRKRPVPREDEPISLVELSDHPTFRLCPGWMNSEWLSRSQRNSLLAVGIPTLSPAVGNTPLARAFENTIPPQNLDAAAFKPNGWPDRGRDWKTRWLHGDMKDVAFYYNFKLFKFILMNGGLE